jgi:F-type H+-transporting ATPase subunit a
MPEHTSFFSYLIAMFPALGENMHNFGASFLGHKPVEASNAEPLVASAFIVLILILMALAVRAQVSKHETAVIPDAKLSLRTFLELFIGYFYDLMKDMMGPKRAKQYFPIVGTAACFVFFSNLLGLIPGFNPPTSNWNITAGCAVIVFFAFNYYGFKENGWGHIKHLFGPWLGPLGIPVNILLFVIELFSLFLRPFTLSIRLMLNMAVDHLLVTLALAGFALFLPIPVMILGTLVVVVQTLVFCLLTAIYITLSTEHEDHGEAHDHAKQEHGEAHAHA